MNKIKRHYMLLATAVIAFMAAALTSCSDDKDEYGDDALSISAIVPSKVIAGQEIAITGTGLGNVTSVTFPGGVRVTEFTRVAEGMLYVVTPDGIDPEGGIISVDNGEATVSSRVSLTVGAPTVTAASPVDQAAKINEQVQAFGTDLEFISQALFPAADGTTIAVEAAKFRRKSTSALSIPVPYGIAAGPAQIVLVDCSGKHHFMPAIELSDKVSGGEETPEPGTVIWDAGYQGSWDFLEIRPADLSLNGKTLKVGSKIRFVFDGTQDDSRFCICLGEGWSAPDLGGESDPNNISIAGMSEYVLTVDEAFLAELTGGVMRIGGVNFSLVKIVLLPTPIWEGEHETGWWWYLPPSELDFSDGEPEVGKHLKFTFKEHDAAQTFCLCDGYWGTPDLGGSPDINNVAIPAGQNEITCEIYDNLRTALLEGENALILGGEVIITKIEIVD